jgi:hypothetical protein
MSAKIYRGDTWTRTWEIISADGSAVDLTGATIRLQVRDTNDAVVIEATTNNGYFTIDSNHGRIDMNVPYSSTNISPGNYKFDLEVTHANGIRRTYEQGTLIVLEDVTHD